MQRLQQRQAHDQGDCELHGLLRDLALGIQLSQCIFPHQQFRPARIDKLLPPQRQRLPRHDCRLGPLLLLRFHLLRCTALSAFRPNKMMSNVNTGSRQSRPFAFWLRLTRYVKPRSSNCRTERST